MPPTALETGWTVCECASVLGGPSRIFYTDQNKVGAVVRHLLLPAGAARFFFQFKISTRPLSLSLSPAPAASVCRLYERRDTELSPGYKCTSSFLIGVLLMTAFIFKYSKAPSGSMPGLSYPSYVTQAWWCRRPEKACRVTFLLLLTWNKLSTFWRGNMSPACDSS